MPISKVCDSTESANAITLFQPYPLSHPCSPRGAEVWSMESQQRALLKGERLALIRPNQVLLRFDVSCPGERDLSILVGMNSVTQQRPRAPARLFSACFVQGRSGTGKTTVIVKKLLGLETAYKSADIPLRQLLVTKSPKLCAAIKRYGVIRLNDV